MKKSSGLFLLLAGSAALMLTAQETAQAIDSATLLKVKTELLQKYGETEKFRVDRGLEQVAALWRAKDGGAAEFAIFCRANFAPSGAPLDSLFNKLEFYGEALNGNFNEMSLDKDQPVDLDWGEITPLDIAMNQFDLSAHLSEDMFENKIAFISLLNFPVYSLAEKPPWAPAGAASSGPSPGRRAATARAFPPMSTRKSAP